MNEKLQTQHRQPPSRNRFEPPEINSTHTNDSEQESSDEGGLIEEKL
jgi:hypothetical protein